MHRTKRDSTVCLPFSTRGMQLLKRRGGKLQEKSPAVKGFFCLSCSVWRETEKVEGTVCLRHYWYAGSPVTGSVLSAAFLKLKPVRSTISTLESRLVFAGGGKVRQNFFPSGFFCGGISFVPREKKSFHSSTTRRKRSRAESPCVRIAQKVRRWYCPRLRARFLGPGPFLVPTYLLVQSTVLFQRRSR